MNCRDARDALLVADTADFVGSTTPLALHLQTCADCQRIASTIARGTSALAIATAGRASAWRQTSRRIVLLAGMPVAAAVVIGVAMRSRISSSDEPLAPRASLPVARQVSLEVQRGQHATVLKTADPKVTVIWLSSGEGK